jgi:hypothetical protein
MSIGKPISQYLDQVNESDSLNDKINKLAELIDAEVYRHYKLWPNNYIAHDLLHGNDEYKKLYTESDKETFLEYMEKEIGGLAGEREKIEELFLNIYANPLINYMRIK